MLRLLIKQIFCKHEYRFLRNLYGDEIMQHGHNRSVWFCIHCSKIEYHQGYKVEANDENTTA
jgi:hypothetical protein